MAKGRTQKSALNSSVAIALSILSSLLSFVLNAVFIRLLGLEYAGINSIFSGILNLLNIADLGISNAILYRLYKKINDKDHDGINLMLTTYRRICYIVAGVILVGGLCCMPFLDSLVKSAPTFPEKLWTLFIIVLATSVVKHSMDYRRTMLVAKQDKYILSIIDYICLFSRHGLQLLVLFLFKNIYLYLGVTLLTTLVQCISGGIISKKKYNVEWNSPEHISSSEKVSLVKDTGSLAVYKFCRTLDATIDTLLVGKFVSVATTAIYSSTHVIISALEECFGNINDGMMASIGDLNASGDDKKLSSVFYQTMHMTYLIFGVISVALVPILSPLVKWWIGYTLTDTCIYVMLLNFFMGNFGNHVATFRNSMGIFKKGWKRPAFTAFFNLVFSFLLVRKFGLIGTLFGTTIARTLTTHWYDPMLVCKIGWGEKPWKYYFRFMLYLIIIVGGSVLAIFVNNLLPPISGFVSIVWHGAFLAVLAIGFLLLLGSIIPEQRLLLNRVSSLVASIVHK